MVGHLPSPRSTPRRYGVAHNLLQGARTAYKHRHKIVRAGRAVGREVRRRLSFGSTSSDASSAKRHKPAKTMSVEDGTNAHSGLASSVIKINHVPAKHTKGTMGKWEYHLVQSGYISAPAGKQQGLDVYFFNTPTQLCGTTTTTPTTLINDIGLIDMNPYLTNTGSRILGSSVTPANDRFYLKGFKAEIEISNFCSVGAYVDVYLVRAKKTIAQSPFNTWNQGYINEAFGQAVSVVPSAGSTTTGLVAGYESSVNPGAKPTDSVLFKSCYHVESVRHLELTGGSSERLSFDVFLDKVVKKDVQATYIANATPYVAGQTYGILAVSRGTLVNDITFLATTGEICTYGQIKLGYVINTHYYASAVKNAAGRLGSNRAYVGIPSGADQVAGKQTMILNTDASSAVTMNP